MAKIHFSAAVSLHQAVFQKSSLPINTLSANLTKWSNAPKQFVGNLPTYCVGVFDHLVGLTLKVLMIFILRI